MIDYMNEGIKSLSVLISDIALDVIDTIINLYQSEKFPSK